MGFRFERRVFLLLVLGFLVGCEQDAPTVPLFQTQVQPVSIGSRSVAILLFYDDTVDISTLRTPAEYEGMLFSEGRRAFETWSLGKASLTGRVFGWFRVTDLAHRSKTELRALAAAAGYGPTMFNITGYVLSSYSGSGVAVPREGQGEFTVGTSAGTGLILHELLHVCGLGHANKCMNQKLFPVSPVKTCGDRHSIMGSNIFGEILGLTPTAMHREMLGWITVPVADSAAEAKEFPLGLFETTGDALKVPRSPRDWFYIERRADGLHVCTVDPSDRKGTVWLPDLPIVDKASQIEIHPVEGGVKVIWPGASEMDRDPDTFVIPDGSQADIRTPTRTRMGP